MTLVGRRSELPTQALSDFHIRTGVTVTTESAGGDDTLLLRLAAGGYGEFDVIIVSGDTLAYLVESQQVEPLARKLIPNLSALRLPFNDSPDDNGLRHDVPASYDIVGVAVSPVALIESESWTALFSLAERHPGRVVVPDDADDVIGAVLVSLGHAWDTDSNSDLDDAATRLGELFPALRVSGRRPGGGRPARPARRWPCSRAPTTSSARRPTCASSCPARARRWTCEATASPSTPHTRWPRTRG